MQLFSVVVAFYPNIEELESLCQELRRNGSEVIVVDNTEDRPRSVVNCPPNATLVTLAENTGIAHAFNVGIKLALERGAEIVILFDQDSRIEDGFLSLLVAPLKSGQLGVVAPVAFDKRNGNEYPAERLGAYGSPTDVYSHGRSVPYAADLVISSGCAATAETFRTVGMMDEDFFIDFVDYEWCLRCRQHGVRVVVVPTAVLHHAVGEVVVRRGRYRGIVHGPARTYYKIRNCFLLFRKPHVPTMFAARQLTSAMAHNLIQLAFVKEKRLYLRTFAIAVRDGLAGVIGKRPSL